MAQSMIDDYMISVRRACLVVMIHRSLWYYKPYGRDDMAIRHRILEKSQVRLRYGVERIFVLLRREGWRDSFNRIYRIYKEEGLNLRTKRPKRRRAAAHRQERTELSRINQCWSMDFISDLMFDGRRFRALTIVDNFSRKCTAINADQYLKGPDVVNVLDRWKDEQNEVPERIQVDNGSEFISKVMDTKIEVIKAHQSELERVRHEWITFITRQNANDGQKNHLKYAECFEIIRYVI